MPIICLLYTSDVYKRQHIAMGVFDVFQIPYSAVQHEHEALISQAAAAGAGTLIRGGAARGAPADDKQWKQGPIGLSEGDGQRDVYKRQLV